jgi:hypothetical protein
LHFSNDLLESPTKFALQKLLILRMKRLSLILLGCAFTLIFCNATGCKSKNEVPQNTAVAPTPPTPPAAPETPAPTATTSDVMPDLAKVKIKTKYGDMTVALYNETPLHRDNFLKLAEEKYYDGLLFHRCMRSFMIQGGDPGSRGAAMSQMLGTGGPGYTVPSEFRPNLIHKKGALAAARQPDEVNPKKLPVVVSFILFRARCGMTCNFHKMKFLQVSRCLDSNTPRIKSRFTKHLVALRNLT